MIQQVVNFKNKDIELLMVELNEYLSSMFFEDVLYIDIQTSGEYNMAFVTIISNTVIDKIGNHDKD